MSPRPVNSQAEDTSARNNRPTEGATPTFVLILNGSGLALPRVIIPVLENGQRKDGSVEVPQALHPYTGFEVIEGP